MTKHIHWLLDIEDGSYESVVKATMASQRLRAGCMMQNAGAHNAIVTAGKAVPENASHLIIGKMGTDSVRENQSHWLNTISSFQCKKGRTVLDFTDNHLDLKTELTDFYMQTLNIVDQVVCSSDHLSQALRKHFHGHIYTIPDPIEVNLTPPKTSPSWPRTILWFGHSSNLTYLLNFLPFLHASAPIRLLILSDLESLHTLQNSKFQKPDNLLMEFREWTIDSLVDAAAESDCCIIPSDPQDPRKSGASSNRLLTALALGLPTVASGLASYLPFAQYFNSIESDQSINVIIDPCAYSQQVLRAQEAFISQYSVSSIGTQWFNLPIFA